MSAPKPLTDITEAEVAYLRLVREHGRPAPDHNVHHNIHACPSPRCRNRAGLIVVSPLPALASVEW